MCLTFEKAKRALEVCDISVDGSYKVFLTHEDWVKIGIYMNWTIENEAYQEGYAIGRSQKGD